MGDRGCNHLWPTVLSGWVFDTLATHLFGAHRSMASLADTPDLVGFFSYSREDDEGSGGRLSKLRERIQEELRAQLGRTKRTSDYGRTRPP